MKRIKKLAGLLLAMLMVLSMTMTAFAADETTDPTEPTTPAESTNEDEQTPAQGSPVIGQKPTIASAEYSIYQVFTGDYSEGILSNVKWGRNGSGVEGESVKADVLEALEALTHVHDSSCYTNGTLTCGKKESTEYTDVERLAVIESYAKITGEDAAEPVRTGTATSYTGLDAGYYLVKGTVTFSDGQSADTLYVVRVIDGTLQFEPKVDVPTSTKKIVDEGNRVDTNDAAIGDTVSYEITGTLPSNYDSYKEYYYVFTDTLSKGLSLNATYSGTTNVVATGITITVDDRDVTSHFYKEAVVNAETGVTTITVGIQNLKRIDDITKDSVIIVTYDATLNENAVIAGTGNPNDVVLNYSNNPNQSGDGETTPPEEPEKPVPEHPTGVTPRDEVKTYTTELAVLKTDEAGKILTGAAFTLTGAGVKVSLVTKEEYQSAENGEYWKLANGSYTTIAPVTKDDDTNNEADYDLAAGKFNLVRTITKATEKDGTEVVATIDEDGRVVFTGLGEGTYTLKESVTPSGYNTIEDITFTVSFNPTTEVFLSDKMSLGVNNTLETTIINQRGSLLPSTGGIGTTIFYVVGGILVIGAGILLVAKKRMSASK